jgi:hypothetical protein
LRLEKVVEIRLGVPAADGRGALGVQQGAVGPKARVLHVERALGREQRPAPAVARTDHAVEHVDAARDAVAQILRLADAHEVAWLLLRQQRVRVLDGAQHRIPVLADAQSAQRVPGKVERQHRLGTAVALLEVGTALHDAEEKLVVARVGFLRAARPVDGAVDGGGDLLRGRRQPHALVERHDDVGAEVVLDADRVLGPQEVVDPVDRAAEADPVVGHLDQIGEREDLEAAGIGQPGLVPRREAVEAAEVADDLVTRPKEQVVGVGEDDLRAHLLELPRLHRAHGRARRHRHEDRGFDHAMGGVQPPGAGAVALRYQLEHQYAVFSLAPA